MDLEPPKSKVPRGNEKNQPFKLPTNTQTVRPPSLKWSTGAGPKIGCIADYPQNLRVQALEYVDLSPRASPRSSNFNILTDLTPFSKICNVM